LAGGIVAYYTDAPEREKRRFAQRENVLAMLALRQSSSLR
jgi:hypothetical protein